MDREAALAQLLADPVIAKFTQLFIEKREGLRDHMVQTVLELAIMLDRIQARLRMIKLASLFPVWREHLGLRRRTAYNYTALASLNTTFPGIVQQWSKNGIAKLYMMGSLEPAMRTKFLKEHTSEEAETMNDAQFSALIDDYRTEEAQANPNQLAHGFKLRARG